MVYKIDFKKIDDTELTWSSNSKHASTTKLYGLLAWQRRWIDETETEAVEIEHDDTEELIHNIHTDRHKYPPPLPSAPASHTHARTTKVGMHDIYRTDKLSTDMGENDLIFIAPINKWKLITRSDKVRLLVNQSISLIYLRFILFPSASDCNFKLQWLVSRSLHHHLWTCLCRSRSFSRWQRRTMPLLFPTHVQQGFREEEKKASSRVVTVKKFSHRLIDVWQDLTGITVVGGRLSFPSFTCFASVLNSL